MPLPFVYPLRQLIAAASEFGISLDARQQACFKFHFEFLESQARLYNLTGARGWHQVRDELYIRSLGFLSYSRLLRAKDAPMSAIDIGSGAGIPGLVLKILLPKLNLTLMDSSLKKSEFLASARDILGLTDLRIIQERAEEAAHVPNLRARFDVVLARGLAKLPELAELTLPFTALGGATLALKSHDLGDELAASSYAGTLLGAAQAKVIKVSAAVGRWGDQLVVWEKVKPTPERYPRRPGTPHRKPLESSASRPARPLT